MFVEATLLNIDIDEINTDESDQATNIDESDQATPLGLTFFKVLIILNIFVFHLQRSILCRLM